MRIKYILIAIAFALILLGSWARAEEPAEQDHAAQEADHGAHGLNWFDFTKEGSPPVVALIANFVILVMIVYFVLRKPLKARFKNRKDTLVQALKEAEEAKSRAEKAIKEARARIEAIDSEMASLREEVLGAGEATGDRLLKDAKEQGDRMRADAKAMVEHEIAQMAQGIRQQVAQEVVEMAERLVKEKIGNADHARLTDEYLEGMRTELKER